MWDYFDDDLFESKEVYPDPQSITDYATKFLAALVKEYLFNTPRRGNANDHLDEFLQDVRHYIAEERLDPYEEHNVTDEIKYVYIEGFRSIKRTGQATVKKKENYLFLDAKLGFSEFYSEVKFKNKIWWLFWISGYFYIDSDEFDFRIRFSASLYLSALKFKIDFIKVLDWDDINTSFEGKNIIGQIVSCCDICSCFQRKWVRKNMPKMIRNSINQELEEYSIDWSLSSLVTPQF